MAQTKVCGYRIPSARMETSPVASGFSLRYGAAIYTCPDIEFAQTTHPSTQKCKYQNQIIIGIDLIYYFSEFCSL
jgi:hypothetical protein